MLDGWWKADPPTIKKLPVESDVPEWLVDAGMVEGAGALEQAVGDLALIAFYYLLRVGEYTKKGTSRSTQTVPFRMKDITFFGRNAAGALRQIRRDAPDEVILRAAGCTMRLGNQKNGWKNVCLFHESNEAGTYDCIRAIGRRYCHVRSNVAAAKFGDTPLSAYFEAGKRADVTDRHISAGLKMAATALDYPGRLSIPIDRIDTHSLRCGGAMALSLSGFSDTQIQKMGRWRGDTFKEYIREQIAGYSAGMSKAMRTKFQFVNVVGGVHDVTNTVVTMDYEVNASAAAA